jgi:hypothetical protein
LSFPDLFLNLGPKDFSSVEENALDFWKEFFFLLK